MWKEFKIFIARGNVVDLAVAFMLGAAFGRVVTSLVDDIIMPPLGLILGRVNFSNLFISLTGASFPSLEAAKTAGAPTINYGLFINTLVSFFILAFVMFIIVKSVNRLQGAKKAEAPVAPTTRECPFCFSVISLKATRCPHCTSPLSAV
ncbi:MAG: large conductance mechanosensitive channel protein MscL [Deltaproteobacteria bacterium]|nr:large conductance mechanosensitive channel protein MscL [Deltaproteobacteria bacterium]